MITAFKNAYRRNPVLLTMLLTLVFAPHVASAAGFISKALSNSTALTVIQLLGGVGIAINLAGVIQGFFDGNSGDWLKKGIGIVVSVVLVIEPSLLSSTFNAMGL